MRNKREPGKIGAQVHRGHCLHIIVSYAVGAVYQVKDLWKVLKIGVSAVMRCAGQAMGIEDDLPCQSLNTSRPPSFPPLSMA